MRIIGIEVFRVDAPIPGGVYRLSGGRTYSAFDVTVVAVHSDSGLTGWGEIGTLGTDYLTAYGGGVRSGLREIAPALIGECPLEIERINRTMDQALAGHPYAKSPLDIACWDLLGQHTGLPVSTLLGGRFGGPIPMIAGVPTDTPERMLEAVRRYRGRGYRCHSIKLGGDVHEDIERLRALRREIPAEEETHADSNRGWTVDQAVRVMRGVANLDLYFEQPCASFEECLEVRRRTHQPIILDEIVDSPAIMLRIIEKRVADMINIKISRVGGLSRAREIRSLCQAAGLPVSLQDTGGGTLTQAAVLHLACSTPENLRRSVYNPLDYCEHPIGDNGIEPRDGRLDAPEGPGLGIKPPPRSILGEPAMVFGDAIAAS